MLNCTFNFDFSHGLIGLLLFSKLIKTFERQPKNIVHYMKIMSELKKGSMILLKKISAFVLFSFFWSNSIYSQRISQGKKSDKNSMANFAFSCIEIIYILVKMKFNALEFVRVVSPNCDKGGKYICKQHECRCDFKPLQIVFL